MADGGVDIDLYGDDLNEGFNQSEEFPTGDGNDLYDDVLAAPSNTSSTNGQERENTSVAPIDRLEPSVETNGTGGYQGQNSNINHIPRRHQLYVGNLTWWTTDQDITDAVNAIGVSDFQEVKFFENRANGQSKGFCVVSLGSEQSMRLVMERLNKKELHGQNPVVTLPTKQALNNFEAQQKTRPTPPTQQGGPRGPVGMGPGMSGPGGPPQMGGPRMGPGPPGGFRPMHPGMNNMQGPPGMPPRMQGPPMNQGGMPMQQGPPRYQNQGQWNGPPRPNGPMRPNMGPQGPHQRPMFQGGPPRGPWNGPMQGGPPGYQGGHRPPMMQGPPRGPVPQQMGPMGPGQGGPAPHVNPAFFNQNAPGGPLPPPQGGGGAPPPQHFNQQGPRAPWSQQGVPKPANQGFNDGPVVPSTPISEVEFEEIMARNRTVSSSAIARAVSDAAAGEYSSAIETLVTAISLIKQSKVAHDERCKILISSLQDTLHGIESKSYSRRERSRSRDRSHRRPSRRDRSTSRDRYKEKRYSRERSRERDRDRDSRYHSESDRREREVKSRSRDRDRAVGANDYRDEGRHHSRPRNKSPETPTEANADSSKRNYYEDRYRSSDRERERDRDRREEHRSRH